MSGSDVAHVMTTAARTAKVFARKENAPREGSVNELLPPTPAASTVLARYLCSPLSNASSAFA